MQEPAISVVVALYNEAGRFQENFKAITNYLEKNFKYWEVILVDDGSTDDTATLLMRLKENDERIRIMCLASNTGQGAALRMGMMAAEGRLIAYADADGATPIQDLEKLLLAIKQGCDIAIASRWMQGAHVRKKQPTGRRRLGRIFYKLINALFPLNINDVNCGFKAYTKEAARILFAHTRSKRWAFNTEHLMLAQRLGLAVKEIPVQWDHKEDSKVRLFYDIVYTLWELFLIKTRLLLGLYPAAKRERE